MLYNLTIHYVYYLQAWSPTIQFLSIINPKDVEEQHKMG